MDCVAPAVVEAHTTVSPTAIVGVRIGRQVGMVVGVDLAVARWLPNAPRLLGGYVRGLVFDGGTKRGSVLELSGGAAWAPWEGEPLSGCDTPRPMAPVARLGFGYEPRSGNAGITASSFWEAILAAGVGVSIPLSGQGPEATLVVGLGWTFVR